MFSSFKTVTVILITLFSFSFAQEADVTLSIDGTNLNYESSADIYGFQFDHDGCAVGAGGGDAAAAGFMISCSITTCLGFSMSGAFIPAGDGTLLDLGGECSTISELVFAGAEGDPLTAELSDGGGDPVLPTVSIVNPADGSSFDDATSIDVEASCSDCGDGDHYHAYLDGAMQGMFYEDDFSINVGFGDHTLTVTLADGGHQVYDHEGSSASVSFSVLETSAGGCDDPSACNDGDPDNDCLYGCDCIEVPPCYSCEGDGEIFCSCDIDCAGDCGGDAVEDECGECNGDGIADGACDCDGNVEDECGECGGDGSSCVGEGCTDSDACNYDADATVNDGSCYSDEAGCTASISGDCEAAGGVGDYTFAGCVDIATSDDFLASCEALGVGESIELACIGSGGPAISCAQLANIYEQAYSGDCEAAIESAISGFPNTLCLLAGDIAVDTYDSSCDDLAASGCAVTCADPVITTTVDVLYNSDADIYGFQFLVNGVDVVSVSGGDAEANGFTVSTGNGTVLGFSFSGSLIPAGNGVLTTLEVQGDANAACLSDLVLSGINGTNLGNAVEDCLTVTYTEPAGGCDDPSACNDGDPDNDCLYGCDCIEVPPCYSCEGDGEIFCSCDIDCAGDCGGDAVEDECGECNGDGIADGACDCDGNVEDECGECGGDGSSCAPSAVQFGFGAVSDGTLEITYSSADADIYGFQFALIGVTVLGASGGDAEAAGFTQSSSSGSGMVLGFSLTGSFIPAGSGILTNIAFAGSGETCFGGNIVVSGYDGESLDIAVADCITVDEPDCDDVDADGICDDIDDCVGAYDECGECNGDGIADGACDCDGNVEDECGECGGDGSSCATSSVDVLYNSDADIYGFQFLVTNANVISAGGGAADAAGFTTSTGNNTVLGFSFSGSFIPAGSGVLTTLEVQGDANAACLSDLVLSGINGTNLGNAVEDCLTVTYTEPACDDVDADGICDDVDDCVGEYDECGECNGDGIADGACDCAGNVEDECGVCGGDGIADGACDCDGNVEDECGVCNGDGSSCAYDGVFGLELNSDGDLNVTYDCGNDIYGFQFHVTDITITGVSGGAAADAGFTLSSSSETSIVLGFSLTGSFIPAGSGVLTVLSFGGAGEACITDLIVSGAGGAALDANASTTCVTITCDDDVDADGICDDIDDCVGAYDECGVCNGDGIADDACDCAGNVDLGCGCGEAGPSGCDNACGSTAEVDECGVCGGTGIPDEACDCDGNVDLGCGCGEAGPSGCDNTCGSTAEVDECGECGGNGIDDGECDCDGNVDLGCGCGEAGPSGCDNTCGSTLEFDECGVCGGSGIPDGACDCDGNVEDCAGECGGSAVVDECGECNGDGIDDGACDCAGNVEDCAGECGGSAVVDECGECNGDGIDDGACDCDGNVEDCAGICGGSAANCPDWEDDEFAYEFTASMTAVVLNNDGEALGDDGDLLAAIDAAGNVRGISAMQDGLGDYSDATLHAITIRSNQEGDAISFQYYDASADEVLQSSTSYTFVINDLVGNLMIPHEINVGSVSLSIDMGSGWNWFSVNVVGDDMSPNSVLATLEPDYNDQIKDQSNFSVYYGEDYGWLGGITEIDVKLMYMISTSNAGTLVYAGVPVNPGATPISVSSGWNWIGYLPQSVIETNDALGTVVAGYNDQIKDQSSFSVYYGEDYGWLGGITEMNPGKGYMLSVSFESDLIYPNGPSGMTRMALGLEEGKVLPATISSWTVNPRDYEFNATMTISIDSHEDFNGDYVGVFVGDQCRGFAERKEFAIDGSYNYSVMVYSDETNGEQLSFKYYNAQDDEIINYGENVEFTANMNVGNGLNTFGLVSATGISGQPTAYGISDAYPNPFNPVTSFEFTIEVDGMVEVAVYDINGRQVAELVNGYSAAGTYPVVWDASDLSSGVYIVHMLAGEYSTMQKVMLIK